MYQYINFGNFNLSSYGLLMAIGVLLSCSIILLRARQAEIGSEEIIIVMATAFGAALFAAGLLYIIVSYPIKEIIAWIAKGDFTFLKNGGLVFYGGLIGGIIGALLACRWQQLDVRKLERCAVPILPLGHAIGRVGCLLAGCCHGFLYSGPLAVKSVLGLAEKTYFPIQGVEAFLNLGMFIFLLWYARKERPAYHILWAYLFFYSTMRFVLEFFRGDLIRGNFLMLSTSQWISIIIFLIGIFANGNRKDWIKKDLRM